MKKYNLLTKVSILLLCCATNNALFGAYIWNNTMWDIKYKYAQPAEDAQETPLKAGEIVAIDSGSLLRSFSIRRSGFGSTFLTYWYAVPTANVFADPYDQRPARMLSPNDVLIVESTATGWSFRAGRK